MRWGERLEFTAEAGPGGFVYVPFVPHQEINALDDEPLECVLARSGPEAIVANLALDVVADPEHVPWVDPAHPPPPGLTAPPRPDPRRGRCSPSRCQRLNDAIEMTTVH
jgi:hypothetical protein